jgi:hypothetical protein
MSDVPSPPAGTPGPAPLAFPAQYADHFPCQGWATVAEIRGHCDLASQLDDDTVQVNIDAATELMYYLLGQQFGICQTSFRPCLPNGCSCADAYFAPSALMTAGFSQANQGCCCRIPQVDCGALYPVNDVLSVHFNGASQPVADFHVDDYRYVVRNDGERFPTCNVMWDVATAPQNADLEAPFEIAVEYGYLPPKLAKLAARVAACNLIEELTTGSCGLPDRVVSYTRQGLTAQVASAQDLLQSGQTGIHLVDLAVRTFNPLHQQSDAFVFSPDTRQGGRRTYTS